MYPPSREIKCQDHWRHIDAERSNNGNDPQEHWRHKGLFCDVAKVESIGSHPMGVTRNSKTNSPLRNATFEI